MQVNGRDVSQSSHEEAVAAFLTAQEPITVEVLRRPVLASSTSSASASKTVSVSVPVSHRNSVYIPHAKSPSPSVNRAESSRSAASGEAAEVIEGRTHDHEFEEDEEMLQVPAGTEDLLVPGLDYEVNIAKMQNICFFRLIGGGVINTKLLSNCYTELKLEEPVQS